MHVKKHTFTPAIMMDFPYPTHYAFLDHNHKSQQVTCATCKQPKYVWPTCASFPCSSALCGPEPRTQIAVQEDLILRRSCALTVLAYCRHKSDYDCSSSSVHPSEAVRWSFCYVDHAHQICGTISKCN